MTSEWVCSIRPTGGKSRWHLLSGRRRGHLYNTQTVTDFILTVCGEGIESPLELRALATAAPVAGSSSFARGDVICRTCELTAWRLDNSVDLNTV